MQENKGKYLLVIEGAIPVKDNGIYCKIACETMPGLAHEVAEHATAYRCRCSKYRGPAGYGRANNQ